jgi:hypothetical protein
MKIEANIALYLYSADGKEKHEFNIRGTINSRMLWQLKDLD